MSSRDSGERPLASGGRLLLALPSSGGVSEYFIATPRVPWASEANGSASTRRPLVGPPLLGGVSEYVIATPRVPWASEANRSALTARPLVGPPLLGRRGGCGRLADADGAERGVKVRFASSVTDRHVTSAATSERLGPHATSRPQRTTTSRPAPPPPRTSEAPRPPGHVGIPPNQPSGRSETLGPQRPEIGGRSKSTDPPGREGQESAGPCGDPLLAYPLRHHRWRGPSWPGGCRSTAKSPSPPLRKACDVEALPSRALSESTPPGRWAKKEQLAQVQDGA